MKLLSTILIILLWASRLFADATTETPPPNGLRENTPRVFALTNAHIVQAAGRVIERGSIVVRDGRIEAVGADVVIPADARVFDFKDRTIYPGLIDSYSELPRDWSRQDPTLVEGLGAKYWNPQIVPQIRASRIYRVDPGANDQLRRAGIVARYVAPSYGIIKGRGALVGTGDEKLAEAFINPNGHLHIRLTPDGTPEGQYPDSPMGAYALVRQAMYDAQWYRLARNAVSENPSMGSIETNDALEALQDAIDAKVTVSIDAPDELYGLRVKTIADEFKLKAVRRGSGYEYRLASQMASTPSVIPVNFPKAPDVGSPEKVRAVSLESLMHWDLAPENAMRLAKANGAFVFSSIGLREIDKWIPQIRLTVERGLDRDEALRALTERAAEMYGSEKEIGSLDVGKRASFIVTNGELFDAKTKILETWVNGNRFANGTDRPDPRGTWKADVGGRAFTLKITGEPGDLKASYELIADASTQPATQPAAAPTGKIDEVKFASDRISFKIVGDPDLTPGIALASASVGDDLIEGTILYPSGERVPWKATRQIEPEQSPTNPTSNPTTQATQPATPSIRASFEPTWPLGAYGRNALPTEAKISFDHVTIWRANRREPFVGTVKIDGGKIIQIGSDPVSTARNGDGSKTTISSSWTEFRSGYARDLQVNFAHRTDQSNQPISESFDDLLNEFDFEWFKPSVHPTTCPSTQPTAQLKQADDGFIHIDGQNGKLHLTPGIIDAHSHIASDGGINEGGQAVTCEVRIGDFIDPTDISIYRQLAGGVTSANILHGSANPIGGQNQVIKLRWGALPEDLKFAGSFPGVKFALGENVKQSNWGDQYTTRYPQTRMGVEQIMLDSFRAARDYERRWDEWNKSHTGIPPRRDLELDALLEIVSGKRMVHCHSYRQDEILALMRTAEKIGFKIDVFQHILEGYKVAPEMATHGAAGSTFADWWAYKIEVYEAIPFNGALMHRAGVNVSFNSDDPEMARRLNLEAAKAIKYGNVDPAEAFDFVTFNPARQLRIDGQTGSIDVGKDADVVLWNGPPMSVYSHPEQTWVDGRKYFDRNEDTQLRATAQKQKSYLIQKILSSGAPIAGPDEFPLRPNEMMPRYDTADEEGHR